MSTEPTAAPKNGVIVDCEKGRALGCQSFCCALIIRLGPGERDPTKPDDARKHCVDKDPATGRCVHQEPVTGLCRIWQSRPAVCRAYDCNDDPFLQIVVRQGFRSLMQLIASALPDDAPKVRVPYVDE